MLKMVDGTGIIGLDMVCPLGISTPQPPNYDRVELEGTGMLVLPNSLDAPLERLELGGKTEQAQTSGKNLLNIPLIDGNVRETQIQCNFEKNILIHAETVPKSIQSNIWRIKVVYKDNTLKYVVDSDMQKGSLFAASPENPIVSINYRGLYITEGQYEKIQVEYGDTATPYEPHTGNKPSPSPEYLQEIKNSGKWNEETQKYEVDVKVAGKNLFDAIKARSLDNWIASNTHPGYSNFPIFVGKNKKVTFSYNENINSKYGFYLGINYNKDNKVNKWLYNNGGSSSTNKATVTSTEDYIYLSCNTSSIETFIGTFITFQIEIKSDSTSFQSYKEQTLTLTSDRPITKWDRLVEQGGQIGWLYGGKIIDSYNSELIDTEYMSSTGSLTVGATVLYKLKEPEFVPLPQSEQNAIRALKTYYPTTVITADGGEVDPDIKVTYRKEI